MVRGTRTARRAFAAAPTVGRPIAATAGRPTASAARDACAARPAARRRSPIARVIVTRHARGVTRTSVAARHATIRSDPTGLRDCVATGIAIRFGPYWRRDIGIGERIGLDEVVEIDRIDKVCRRSSM